MSHLRDAPRKCGGKEEDKAEKYQKFLWENPSLQGRIDSIVFSVLQCLIFCYHALAAFSLVCLPDILFILKKVLCLLSLVVISLFVVCVISVLCRVIYKAASTIIIGKVKGVICKLVI